jgi:hypothetical protein
MKAATEGPIEGFRLRYFLYSDVEIYYEIYLLDNEALDGVTASCEEGSNPFIPRIIDSLSQFEENSIQFIHYGKLIVRKSLSKLETEILLQLINQISIKLTSNVSGQVMICPHIESSLHIESVNLTAFITWSNGDVASELESLKPILKLVCAIENSIDIDFTDLEMPIYM